MSEHVESRLVRSQARRSIGGTPGFVQVPVLCSSFLDSLVPSLFFARFRDNSIGSIQRCPIPNIRSARQWSGVEPMASLAPWECEPVARRQSLDHASHLRRLQKPPKWFVTAETISTHISLAQSNVFCVWLDGFGVAVVVTDGNVGEMSTHCEMRKLDVRIFVNMRAAFESPESADLSNFPKADRNLSVL